MKPSTELSLSIVVPCYNEVDVLPVLQKRLTAALDGLGIEWEVILIDDGSSDASWEEMRRVHQRDQRFKAVAFSRNFGHQRAVSAGLTFARGDVVAVMDADLQDPPELLPACLEKIAAGYDVVFAVRRKRKEHFLKRAAYSAFYRLLKTISDVEIPLDAGDFCVMTRRVVDVLGGMRESNIFVRGLRAWVGFKQIGLEYERGERAAGKTKYSFLKLVRLANDGLFSFSILPLRVATTLGILTLMLSVGIFAFLILWRLIGFRFMGHTPQELPGWTALAIGLLFFGAMQLLILGVLGEYLGRIYTEVKERPRWVVREALGLPEMAVTNLDAPRSRENPARS